MLLAHLNFDFNISSFNATLLNYINSDVKFLDENLSSIELIAFFFAVAAFIKSAQFGFHI
jgi:NADH:ubiquinone oxidoreductase subunit 5 (subunit L)/multisubunit Na+/H+ antiporter MnhA subunit